MVANLKRAPSPLESNVTDDDFLEPIRNKLRGRKSVGFLAGYRIRR